MKQTGPRRGRRVRGVVATTPRATKSAALLLASALAVPAFFILTMVEAWML